MRGQTTIIIGMIALRYVYVVALVIWVGGLITIASVVAPSAFAVLEATDSGSGQPLAATLVGEVLRRFHVVAYAAGATLLSTLILMKVVGPRPPGFGARLVLVGAMLGVTAHDRRSGSTRRLPPCARASACPSGRWRLTTPGGYISAGCTGCRRR